MAEINIKSLPLITNPSDDDVLVINVGNEITSGITYGNLKTTNLSTGYFDDGSVSAPSISFINATDTGMYLAGGAAASAVGITSGGNSCIVAKDGKVSFNTTQLPQYEIDCYGDIVARQTVSGFTLGFINDDDSSLLGIGSSSSTMPIFVGSTERARFTDEGLLVNTTSSVANYSLQVGGNPILVQQGAVVGSSASNTVQFATFDGSTATTRMEFNATGAMGVSGEFGDANQALVSAGTDAVPVWTDVSTFISQTDFETLTAA
ncbi:MAG: hypothetical protein CL779_00760 [Chloroflexi bacterium]|nr:hypothetical protein [Chloroflexota bacterium]